VRACVRGCVRAHLDRCSTARASSRGAKVGVSTTHMKRFFSRIGVNTQVALTSVLWRGTKRLLYTSLPAYNRTACCLPTAAAAAAAARLRLVVCQLLLLPLLPPPPPPPVYNSLLANC